MNGTKTATLVLASSSPRRQELIRTLGLPVVVRASDADETVPGGWEPAAIVEELSLRKAQTVAQSLPEGGSAAERTIVVGSDTIVVLDGRVLGKPADPLDAERMLSLLQGRSHQVYSGVACVEPSRAGIPVREGAERLGDITRLRVLSRLPAGEPDLAVGHTVSTVTFRPMSPREIEAYVRTGEPLDKAGSYGIQGVGSFFIEKMEGDFYSVMGLPLHLLYRMLQTFGIQPLGG